MCLIGGTLQVIRRLGHVELLLAQFSLFLKRLQKLSVLAVLLQIVAKLLLLLPLLNQLLVAEVGVANWSFRNYSPLSCLVFLVIRVWQLGSHVRKHHSCRGFSTIVDFKLESLTL